MKFSSKTFSDRCIFESGIGQVVIARFKSRGRVEIGVFLVDVFCLGVKNAFYTQCAEAEFDEFLGDLFSGGRPMDDYSAAWGRKLVEGAIGYASKLGFAPHRDYKKAARVMGGTDPKDCEEKFVFGSDGKPFFVSGPNDTHEKCQRIISILTRKCGADGFNYLTPASDYERLAMDENFPDENMVFEQRKVVE